MFDLRSVDTSDERVLELAPLTEPEIIPCLYVRGFEMMVVDSVVQLEFWASVESTGGSERRIVSRVAMSNSQARNLLVRLKSGLAQGGH
jgi:hypothetical protein